MDYEFSGMAGLLLGILIGVNLPRIQKAVTNLVEPSAAARPAPKKGVAPKE